MATSVDRRRANGPESSYSPIYIEETEAGPSKARAPPQRIDRQPQELRPICKWSTTIPRVHQLTWERHKVIQTGLVPVANGSAYIETGKLKVACAVYGPRQVRGRQYVGKAELNVEVRYVPFATRHRRKAGKECEASDLSALIHSALLPSLRLDLLPKASLDIFITVLEADAPDDGCATAAATAASVALADAGIEMWGLVTGCTAAINIPEEEESPGRTSLLIDPTRAESDASSSSISLWTLPALGTVTGLVTRGGELQAEDLSKLFEALTSANNTVHYVAAKALSDGFHKRVGTQGEAAVTSR